MRYLKYIYPTLGIVVVAAAAGGALYLFFEPSEEAAGPTGTFDYGDTRSVVVPTAPGASEAEPSNTPLVLPTKAQAVFKVAGGPVVSATVIQTLRPTTTVARYIQQHNGHVFDVALDVSGAVPKPVSNTTIPGIQEALWAKNGSAVIARYIDGASVKTVSLTFPATSTPTSTAPVMVKFFPDGIVSMALSPDGERAAYLLRSAQGLTGYVANYDGTAGRQLFSIQLSELLIHWPSPNTLILQSKSAGGVPGIAFSVNVANGDIFPLLYAPGLTLTADPTFSYVIYRTSNGDTQVRQLASGRNTVLSQNPYPEKCIWGSATILYCAVPDEFDSAAYLDLWHAGAFSMSDALFAYDLSTGAGSLVTVPGAEGGEPSAIDTMTVSADGKYLLFVNRGTRALWGVRLEENL